MKILVTGSEGFIGSHVDWKLRFIGQEVFGLDRKQGMSILEYYSEKPPLDFDVVIHCAANLFENFEENVDTTQFLVEALPDARFIFLSSAAVYGNAYDAKEDDKLYPFGAYGKAKMQEEMMVRTLRNHVIFRLSNVFGQGTDHGFIHKCLYGVPAIKYPDHIRDYVHVNDVSSAIVSAAVAFGKHYPSGTYNLSTGIGQRNYEIFKKMNPDIEPQIVESPEEKQEEIAVSVLNPEKAKHYGFHPRNF